MIDLANLQIGNTFQMQAENDNYEIITVTYEVVDIQEKDGQRIVITKVI